MRKNIDVNAFTDDILTEVLKWVPVDELFGFKCVCKRWDKLISSNYFATVYQSEGRARDNSLSTPLGFYRSVGEYAFFSTLQSCSNREEDAYFKTAGFYFVHSHNGFLLFHNSVQSVYRVCNPVTKKVWDFEAPYKYCRRVAVAFDVPFHKHGTEIQDNCMLAFFVDSYDSCHQYTLYPGSTCWTHTFYWYPEIQDISFEGAVCAVVINRVCYWLSISNSVLSRDLSSTQDSDDAFAKVIPLPVKEANDTTTNKSTSVLCVSKDGLLQYVRSDLFFSRSTKKRRRGNSLKIRVWVLSDDCNISQWVFKHVVSYKPMCSPKIRYARLVACHPSDPEIIFILLNEIIVSYCFRNRRVKRILCIGDRDKKSGERPPWEWSSKIVPYFSPTWAASFLPPPSNIDAQCVKSTPIETPMSPIETPMSPIETPMSHIGDKPWLAALLRNIPST